MSLCAILTHIGRDFSGGHWQAYIVGPEGYWVRYNDSEVIVTPYTELPPDFEAVANDCSLLLYKRAKQYNTSRCYLCLLGVIIYLTSTAIITNYM